MSIASRIESMTEHLTNAWNNVDSLGLYAKKLPKEYTQVDYIASSGTQYIDTGFIPNQDSSIEIEYKKKTDTIVFGSRESLNARTFTLALLGENKIRSDYGTENINITVSSTYIQTIFKREKNKVYINNAEVATHGIQTFTCPGNLYLFGANNNGNVVYGSHNIYYCKIYDNDVLIRDFIPCYRNSDNEVGLYDLVNDVFYTNQGTGAFTYGKIQEGHMDRNLENLSVPLNDLYDKVSNKTDISQNGVVGRTSQDTAILPSEYTQVDYIASSGTQYIDTGVKTNINTKMEADIKCLDNGTNMSGVVYSGNAGWLAIGSYSESLRALFGTSNDTGVVIPYDNDFHKYYISNGLQKIDDKTGDNTVDSFPTTLNIYLFNYNKNYSGTTSVKQQIKYVKIYDNDILIRDFIPCYRNSDNEIGLYDIVNNVFYTNQGTGVFTYGSVVSIPNPDYPQEINNLCGDVTYKISGKNKFDKDSVVSGFVNADGTVGGDTNAYRTSDFIPVKPDTTYYKTSTESPRTKYYDSNKQPLNTTTYQDISIGGSAGTFTTPNNAYYLRFSYPIASVDADSIQIEKGSTATSYEPYIEPQTFNIPLKSKNLFDGLTTKGSYNLTTGEVDTTIYAMWRNTNPIGVNPNNDYVFSLRGTALSVPIRIFYYDINKMFISTETTTNGKFITPADCYYVNWHSTGLYTNYPNGLPNPMIEENNETTDYEPYYDIELCKIGNYEDKIYSSDGRFYFNELNAKVLVNNSSTNIRRNNATSYYIQGKDYIPSLESDGGLGSIMSTKYIKTDISTAIGCFINGGGVIRFNTSKSYTNVSEMINDVGELIFYANLATPTTTEITQENYPSLYNALKQIQDYLTAYKINKEFILGYSSPEIEY